LRRRTTLLILAALAGSALAGQPVPTGAFAFSFEVALPGTPEAMYDALTGDISGWWDHSMSGDPYRLEIEARPGGRFLEVFDESGDGVVHATVIHAERGRTLRLEGPLGLAGHAITMVTTYTLAPAAAGGTTLTLTVHAAGEVHEGWAEVVESTWHHFLDDRFVPYVTAGHHRQESP
jgi:uncharacterized protein YndB with AHSA1/START domain